MNLEGGTLETRVMGGKASTTNYSKLKGTRGMSTSWNVKGPGENVLRTGPYVGDTASPVSQV